MVWGARRYGLLVQLSGERLAELVAEQEQLCLQVLASLSAGSE